MLYLGSLNKIEIVNSTRGNFSKVLVLTPDKYKIEVHNSELIRYSDIIMYKTFYRLLSIIDRNTLIVLNECMRTKNKNDLTYNCLKHFIRQAGDIIIFQSLPIIESKEDFEILNMFNNIIGDGKVSIDGGGVNISCNVIHANKEEIEIYESARENMFSSIGSRDPDIIPRELHVKCGIVRKRGVKINSDYIGRTNKQKLKSFITYRETSFNGNEIIFDFPHNHIDMVDYVALSGNKSIKALISDLPVDRWYAERYDRWVEEINSVYSNI